MDCEFSEDPPVFIYTRVRYQVSGLSAHYGAESWRSPVSYTYLHPTTTYGQLEEFIGDGRDWNPVAEQDDCDEA